MNPVEKYNARARKINSMLCVGLDADFDKMPERFKTLGGSEAQFQFNKYIIDSTYEYAAAFKPNAAFFESRGTDGVEALKKTMDYIHEKYPDVFTIFDAKRADIGNTNKGYLNSSFDWFGFDAVTIHPYLGQEAVQPFLDRKDKCTIVLVRTSNPGAPEFQDKILKDTNEPLWQCVLKRVNSEWNKNKNLMIVVGGINPDEIAKAREIAPDITFLVPGIGAQGGEAKNIIEKGKNSEGLGLIINSSRGIIFSEDPSEEARKLRDEIRMFQ